MIKTVKRITQAVDFVARLVSIFFVLCVLVFMTSQVFFRYVLNSSLQWSEEASIWAMIWMVFIGSVVVVRRWEHIYIPTAVKLLPIKIRSLVIIFTKILVLIFLCVLCWYGWGIVNGHSNAFSHNIGVSTAWAKASVPIGCGMMIVITLGAIAEDLEAIFKKDWARFEEYGSHDAV